MLACVSGIEGIVGEIDCRNLSPSSNQFKNLDGPHIIRVQNQVGPIQGPEQANLVLADAHSILYPSISVHSDWAFPIIIPFVDAATKMGCMELKSFWEDPWKRLGQL